MEVILFGFQLVSREVGWEGWVGLNLFLSPPSENERKIFSGKKVKTPL
jgi:hypothetical protein